MSSKIGLRGLERNTIKNTARTLFEEGYNNPLLRFSFGLYGTIPIGSHINLGNTNEPLLVAKIPVNGTADKWDDISSSSLAAKAKTMQLLTCETTIYLPDILDFSPTTKNAL
ncbi:hypothetical protein F4824DRAFT_494451 [Ustulina deusta]|nr:hypothetical protein F4824DRAFT_494451 [Ustulina deusta]